MSGLAPNKAVSQNCCALCLRSRKLQRSHILPEFLYSEIYDSPGRLTIRSAVEHAEKFRQKGYWEWLLCAECESHIGEWDRYAAHVLQGRIELARRREGQVQHLEGLDYKKLKLFQLSVLWRASASSLDFFKRVSLGPHEEIIRKMLLEKRPGQDVQYPCLMMALIDEEVLPVMIIEPTSGRLWGKRIYRFVFGGFFWVFVVTNQNVKHLPNVLSMDGKVSFLLQRAREWDYLTELIGRVIARDNK